MKLFTRCLSLILSFQLLVGCNELRLVDKPDSGFVEISGSVARAVNHITNFILPSAAASEGEIRVFDVSDPDDPIEIYSETISDSTFTIKVKKELVVDRPLKISFESFEEEANSREIILAASATPENLTAKLNQDSTIKSKITEWQLKIEIEREAVQANDSKTKLATILKYSFETEINIIENKEAVRSLLFHSEKVAKETSYWLAYYRIGLEKNDQELISKSHDNIKKLAMELGYLKVNLFLDKVSEIEQLDLGKVSSAEEGERFILEFVNNFTNSIYKEMMTNNLNDKSVFWIEVDKKIVEFKALKLDELKKIFSNSSNYAETIKKISEISLAKVNSYEEGEELISAEVSVIFKEIMDIMKKDGLGEKDAEWISTLDEIKKAKNEKFEELASLSWSKE